MDEFMLANLTFCRPGMGGGMGFGGGGGSGATQERNLIMCWKVSPVCQIGRVRG